MNGPPELDQASQNQTVKKTGLEEINADLLEADFWPDLRSNFRLARQPEAIGITSYKPTCQDLASFLAPCDSYRRSVWATLGFANPGYFRRQLQ